MRAVREQIEQALGEAEHLVHGLSNSQLQWQPEANAWSILRCLDHLTLTARSMMDRMDPVCKEAESKGWSYNGPWKPGWLARWFVGSMEPPPKFKSKTKAQFDPTAGRHVEDPRSVLAEFRSVHAALLDRLVVYEQCDQNRVLVQSPFVAAVKYKLGTALAIIPAHMRRHNYQAGQVRKHPQFPKE